MKRRIVMTSLVVTATLGLVTATRAEAATTTDVYIWLTPGAAPATLESVPEVASVRPVIASRRVYRATLKVSSSDRGTVHAAVKKVRKTMRSMGARSVEAAPDVEATDERFHAWPSGEPTPAGPSDLTNQPAFAGFDLDQVHSLATGAGVVVAVLDTGVDPSHELLQGSLLPGYDMVDDDADPADATNGVDTDGRAHLAFGHGTFVAGVVHQIAPDAKILPVRVLDDDGVGGLPAIVEGINFAIDAGADVINMSLGITGKVGFPPLREAVKRARAAGILVVASAGNTGDTTKNLPADRPDVVSVTAVSRSGQLASFANRGPWVDVAAPGVDVVSAAPGNTYESWGGSSVSAGIVSGQLALLAQRLGFPGPTVITDVLWKSCKPALAGTTEHGIVDVLRSITLR